MMYYRFSGIPVAATALTLLAQPVWAAPTQVTAIQLKPTAKGIELTLNTQGDRPPVFTASRGKSTVADITNSQLRLPGSKSWRQNNPAPGITSVVVSQIEANTVRAVVNGSSTAPTGRVRRSGPGVTLNFDRITVAQTQTPARPQTSSPKPTPNLVPPLLPRAVAPPVGDIVVSPVDTTTNDIDLGTSKPVSIFLRRAPVREVLGTLAREAGINLIYVDVPEVKPEKPEVTQSTTTAVGTTATNVKGTPEKIKEDVVEFLDVKDESVQNVFNYVLRTSGLEANRVGRTIFVGSRLPDSARNLVTRTYRLNQVSAAAAASFLTAQGAVGEGAAAPTVGEGAAAPTAESRTPEVLALSAKAGDGPLLLRGLSVLFSERLNSITLVGDPRKIEIASKFLTQLDLRRRQVAVNVKVIDINLLNTKDLNSSFSFGVGRSFFTIDNGAAVFNFGGVNPPPAGVATSSLTSPPTITNPLTGTPFLGEGFFNTLPGGIPSALPPLDPNANPVQPGITDFTPGTPPTGTSPGTPPAYTFGLPPLFQYPLRLLSLLRAQVVSGNAKILTDPTLTVQEGETSTVNLTQEVFGGIRVGQTTVPGSTSIVATREPIIKNAGLTLPIQVERIDDNGFVSLRVNPIVSAPGGTVPTPDGEITLIQERRLDSGLIRLRDSQTLVLTGVIQDTDRSTVTKVPILGDIPLLGTLFRRTNRTRQRQEVIILLTPKVLDDSEQSTYGYQYQPSPEAQKLLQPKR